MSSDIGKLMTYPVNRKQAFKRHVSMSALGRERPLRRPITMSDRIAPREARIGQNPSFANCELGRSTCCWAAPYHNMAATRRGTSGVRSNNFVRRSVHSR